MRQLNLAGLTGFLCAVFLTLVGALVLADGFYFAKHEGDTFHAMEIILRLAEGRTQHRDFMTPIGALAFWPMALLVQAGFGIGKAMLLGQALVGLVLLPVVIWIASTRLGGWTGALFGTAILVLSMALIHGESSSSLSISMHYNRWAWAFAFVAIVLAAVVPHRARSVWVDGILLGLACLGLVMIKATYVVAFVPVIIVAALIQGQGRALVIGLGTGLVGMVVITLFLGVNFWVAYLADLLSVALADSRPFPGQPYLGVVGDPAYLGGTLAALAGVIFLRQGGAKAGGLILMLLFPGLTYVTFQNWGNDPQWLMLLAVLMITWLPAAGIKNGFGWDMRQSLVVVIAMTLAFCAPSYFNMAYSPFRHLTVEVDDYDLLIPGGERHGDLYTPRERGQKVMFRQTITEGIVAFPSPVLKDVEAEDPEEPVVFRGETLEDCSLAGGVSAYFASMAADLEANGFTGDKGVFVADTFSSHWLFTDLRPLKGGAPWYYTRLSGMKDADYFLVPLCSLNAPVRRDILNDVIEAEIEMTEVHRHPLYILYAL